MADDYYFGSGTLGENNVETIRFFDVAHEGAQVRNIAGVVAEGRLERLHRLNPRSLVVVATDQLSRAAAQAVATLRSPLRLPMVVATALPNYVGALDLVVVVGDRNSSEAHQALQVAAARGAVTALVGTHGPVAEDAPEQTLRFPVLPAGVGSSPTRTMSAVCSILDLLEEDPDLVVQRLHSTADAIDTELESLSPERDEMVNLGRQLRSHVTGAHAVHTGNRAIAELVATLWTLKGIPSTSADVVELPEVFTDSDPTEDLFHDPFLDPPGKVIPLKAVVWAAELRGVPAALEQNCSVDTPGPVAEALTLITRGYAATTYTPDPEEY